MVLQILFIAFFVGLFLFIFFKPGKRKRRRRFGQRNNSAFLGGHSADTGTDSSCAGSSFDSGGSCDGGGGYDGGGGCDGDF